jgi:SAM-dependent methyltransferase
VGINYDKISSRYDAVRTGGGPFWPALKQLAAETAPYNVLELGCGTGNNTALFRQSIPCRLTALDLSSGMLKRARAKDTGAAFVLASAFHLPFQADAFGMAFGVYVLHYLRPLEEALSECRRALRPGAPVFFVTAPLEFIDAHPMNRYFPSFAAIERGRFLPEEDLRRAMTAAGFVDVRLRLATAPPRPIDAAYLERVRGKHLSTFDLMRPQEYEQGLAQLERDLAPTGRLATPLVWKALMVEGRRPAA